MSKRLITDRDVLEGRCGTRIVLDGATLITPSARDRALLAGIVIVEESFAGSAMPAASCPRCGSAGAPAAAAAPAAPGALPDGLYLVRVEGGRAVSTLPAAGPGLMPRAIAHSQLRS